MTIPRDQPNPFDPADPFALAEFWGFSADVPNTAGMIDAAGAVIPPTSEELLASIAPGALDSANTARVAKLFSDGFLPLIAAADADPVTGETTFPTPNPVVPDRRLMRSGRARTVDIFPPGTTAGTQTRVWSFSGVNDGFVADEIITDAEGVETIVPGDGGVAAVDMWPAPPIRVVEGEIVHSLMQASHGPHTIHHHGIEPTPVNDGVGHLTMEITTDYVYQWLAGEAGTYFYHCHRNTTLHFELGMYGLLIVDPPAPAGADITAPYPLFGPGYTRVGDRLVRYARETFWVADDIDIRWHVFGDNNRDSGIPAPALDGAGNPVFSLAGTNDNLNDFNSDFFVITGVTVGDGTGSADGVLEPPAAFRLAGTESYTTLYNGIRPVIARNEPLLIRALNASYCTTVWRFPVALQGTVTAVDGRTLGFGDFGSYSFPFPLSSLPLDSTGQHRTFTLTTAQRWDVLINTGVNGNTLGVAAGTYNVLVEFHHWLDFGHILQTAILPVTVT